MAYDLNAKIIRIVAELGIQGASVNEGKLTVGGREIGVLTGVITRDKLQNLVSAYKMENPDG